MIGMTAEQVKAGVENGTSAWTVALRDAALVFGATTVAAVLLMKPESWQDFLAFEHVGVPLLSGIEVFIGSLMYRYKVMLPAKP